ncbi:MAG: hypothetical protein ACRD36_10840, partial [Candidatus Acidiferrum sp.]
VLRNLDGVLAHGAKAACQFFAAVGSHVVTSFSWSVPGVGVLAGSMRGRVGWSRVRSVVSEGDQCLGRVSLAYRS